MFFDVLVFEILHSFDSLSTLCITKNRNEHKIFNFAAKSMVSVLICFNSKCVLMTSFLNRRSSVLLTLNASSILTAFNAKYSSGHNCLEAIVVCFEPITSYIVFCNGILVGLIIFLKNLMIKLHIFTNIVSITYYES